MELTDILKLVLAFFLPPIAVLWHRGCGADLIINIVLWCLCVLPGIIHAFYIILKK